jgi:Cro/C1-type HTH DNA-binding domain
MIQAYSRLRNILAQRDLSVPELHRRIEGQGQHVNLKSLYRLNDEHRPLTRLDLGVAGVICQVCRVRLSELITFEAAAQKLRRLGAAKEKRLHALMNKNNDGALTRREYRELQELVREAEEITLSNAKALANQRRRLATG